MSRDFCVGLCFAVAVGFKIYPFRKSVPFLSVYSQFKAA